MTPRALIAALAFPALTLLAPPLAAQDPALREALQAGKLLWATQGDRDGAAAKVEAVLAALEPAARTLDDPWRQVLCEAYNWMAVLDDRVAARKPQAPRRLESILEVDPDFEIDRAITNPRLQAAFDGFRTKKLGRVKLVLEPAGGVFTLDGKVRAAAAQRHLAPGPHSVSYVRPGFRPVELKFDIAAGEVRPMELKLERTHSVITLFTAPAGVEVRVDGVVRGRTAGRVPADKAFYAERLGLAPEQLSGGFLLADLDPGKHIVELVLPCHRGRRIEIPADLLSPAADHDLEPFRMEPSLASLSVETRHPGGEILLGGRSLGPAPVKDLQVCAEASDLQVRFPQGSFTRRLALQEGRQVTVVAEPKPRLTYAGFEGAEAFAGRVRLLELLAGLGGRLQEVAFFTARKDEPVKACLDRLRAGRESELVLWGRSLPGSPQVELVLATLAGEEERILIKPLEQDPLGDLAERIDRRPRLSQPWAGLTLLDVAGEPGPWVLAADEAARKAGIVPGKAITAAAGQPVADVAAFNQALAAAQGTLAVAQGEAAATLAVTAAARELPVAGAGLSYPVLLADLRLRLPGESGDGAALLRLQQALALMHFREFDKALEVLREARMAAVAGISQGTLDYYTGLCLLRLGGAYASEAAQAFSQALKYPQATLFGPDGPLVGPLAQQALQDLRP